MFIQASLGFTPGSLGFPADAEVFSRCWRVGVHGSEVFSAGLPEFQPDPRGIRDPGLGLAKRAERVLAPQAFQQAQATVHPLAQMQGGPMRLALRPRSTGAHPRASSALSWKPLDGERV